MKPEEQQNSNIVSYVYFVSAIAMAILTIQNYRYGLYDLVYGASLLLALYIGAGLYAQFNPGVKNRNRSYFTILMVALLIIAMKSWSYPLETQQWAYPLGLAGFLILPYAQANIFVTIATGVMTLILFFQISLQEALSFFASYLLMNGTASIYAFLHQNRSRSLVELSIHDSMTKAYNIRHLEDTLKKEICRSQRTGNPLSLIALEIDYFPQIVDLHGRNNADDLVVQLSETLSAMIRAGDSHYYSKESMFYLLLPCTPPEGVLVIAERIRRTVEESNWPVVDAMTLSLGCTSFISADRECNEADLMNESHAALFEAQKNGHNRVSHHN